MNHGFYGSSEDTFWMQSMIRAFLSPQDFGPSSEIIGDLAKQTKSELIA